MGVFGARVPHEGGSDLWEAVLGTGWEEGIATERGHEASALLAWCTSAGEGAAQQQLTSRCL
jgi:hypothetical protein